MKKIGLLLILITSVFHFSLAQKFGYIDTDYIMSKMPDAKKAQGEIDALSSKWEKEVKAKLDEADKMDQQYRAEEILLTEEMKQERLKAIEAKRSEAKEHNKKMFGYEGMLYLKKKELLKPVQDKIYEAVQKVVESRRLQFMFDKAGDLVMIYTDPKHDYTDYVLEELGLGDKEDTVKKNK